MPTGPIAPWARHAGRREASAWTVAFLTSLFAWRRWRGTVIGLGCRYEIAACDLDVALHLIVRMRRLVIVEALNYET